MSYPSQSELTAQAIHFYNEVQRDDRNLALSQGTGIVDHHFGIGDFDLGKVDGLTQEEISGTIRQLEDDQAYLLIDLMGDVLPEHMVLDAGCGRGGTAFRLIQSKGCRIEGITIAPYQADFAQKVAADKGYQEQAMFAVMDMLRTGFRSRSFDHIITNETTAYILSLPDLFNEFGRVLKPGGRYALATWCINPDNTIDNPYVDPINAHYGLRMHTYNEYLEALEATGFSIRQDMDLTDLAIPYWQVRSKWEQASGIEKSFLEGHTNRAILYKMISAQRV